MRPIPAVILGGSDRRPAALPASGRALHPLASYKGVDIQVGGRPLIAILIERLSQAGGFSPLVIAGPARVYAPLGLPARIADCDRSVGDNLRAGLRSLATEYSGPLAVMACDVLPSAAELSELRARHEAEAPCALWLPFVRVPSDRSRLGAFAWKPIYRVALPDGAEAQILPGHFGVLDPAALRLPLLFRLFDAAYRTRNRSIAYRRSVMLRMVLFSLLFQDLKRLATLRAPTLTATILRSGLRLASELRARRLSLAELERLIGRIFLRREFVRLPSERGIRLPILDTLSLAEDADTEEEARAIQGLSPDRARKGLGVEEGHDPARNPRDEPSE